jgi:hypothetical protein
MSSPKVTKPQKNISRKISWQSLWRRSTSPTSIALWVSLVLLLVSFYFSYHVRAYNSDDVIWQNTLLFWKPFHHMTYYGDAGASYIGKIPLYWFIGLFFKPGRRTLFIEGALFVVGNFLLFYWASLYFLRKAKIRLTYYTLLPFIWLASFGYAVSQLFVETSMHNIEVGVIFVACMYAAKIYNGDFWPFKSWLVGVASLIGCLILGIAIVDDRYIIYFGLLPLIVFLLVSLLWQTDKQIRKRIGTACLALFVSLVFAVVVKAVLTKSGIDFQNGTGAQAPQLISYAELYPNISATFYFILLIFGGDFWQRNVLSVITAGTLLNSFLLLVIVRSIRDSVNKKFITRYKKDELSYELFFGLLFIWSVLLFCLSSIGGADATYHYFIILPFIGTLLMCGFIAPLSTIAKRMFVVVIIAAIAFNMVTSFSNAKQPTTTSGSLYVDSTNEANSRDYDIMNVLEANNLTKGYTGYWNANITTYLSQGRVDTMPILCNAAGRTVVFHWLFSNAQRTRTAHRSFYMLDPDHPAPYTCDLAAVRVQLGNPQKIVNVDNAIIYIYNYDITSRIPL